MSDYYDIFQQRCASYGSLFKKTVQNQVEHNFQRFLKSSPNSVSVKINNKGDYITVATLTDKESDTLYKRFFLCDKNDNVKVGDFLYWEDSIWLVFKKEKDTIQAYDKFECLECRHFIKWVNSYGILKEIPCYLVAQTDEKVKANFRTWNNMITPQPNKYVEIITSRTDIELGQRFLIDETAWYTVESDYISVKDILYLSLCEDKKDLYTDDIENDVADIVDLNKFTIQIQSNEINLGIGEEYQVDGKIYLNGVFYSNDIILEIIKGKDLIEINNDMKIKAIAEGSVEAKICMEDHPEVQQDLIINIKKDAQEPVISYELRGDASIKWGRTKVYNCVKIVNGLEEIIDCIFSIEDSNNLLKEYNIQKNSLTITANSNNKVGSIKIIAKNDTLYLEKEVKIVSLWM